MKNSKTYSIPGVRAQTYKPPSPEAKKTGKKPKTDREVREEDAAQKLSDLLDLEGLTPAEKAMRITIWNRVEQRKIAGTAAPLRRNLARYLVKNPQCDVFFGQDKSDRRPGEIDQRTGSVVADVARVTMWNPMRRIKITGNAAPLPKNLDSYFSRNPGMEVYRGQDLHLATETDKNHEDQGQTQTQTQTTVLNSDKQQENPPGIHYRFSADSFAQKETGSKPKADGEIPVHVFHQTHEVVPDSFWTGNTIEECETLDGAKDTVKASSISGSTECADEAMSPQPSSPVPLEGGYPKIGTNEHEFRNLQDMTYEEMASSWSNTPMWTDPNCHFRLEPPECFVTPIYADKSLVFDYSPLDLSLELQTCSIMDHEANGSNAGNPDSFEVNDTGTHADDVNLSFEDYFVDDPAENNS